MGVNLFPVMVVPFSMGRMQIFFREFCFLRASQLQNVLMTFKSKEIYNWKLVNMYFLDSPRHLLVFQTHVCWLESESYCDVLFSTRVIFIQGVQTNPVFSQLNIKNCKLSQLEKSLTRARQCAVTNCHMYLLWLWLFMFCVLADFIPFHLQDYVKSAF